MYLLTFISTRAIASGHEVQLMFFCRIVEGQRIPLSWSYTSLDGDAAAQRDGCEPSAVASLWLGQPPALPVLVKDLADSVFVVVYGHIQRSAADIHLSP